MAPEQALSSADVDGHADIYATGCVAYWLLTVQHGRRDAGAPAPSSADAANTTIGKNKPAYPFGS